MSKRVTGLILRGFLSLHFHSVKGRIRCGMPEVAEFLVPVFAAVDAIVLYFQSTVIFPSWTSRVRVPSPAPSFHSLRPSYLRRFYLCSAARNCDPTSTRRVPTETPPHPEPYSPRSHARH